jgi:3-deoxy-manno-octulosonate cytidylyltransferase (CMP-KDO synthetase)
MAWPQSQVYVATESSKIADHARNFGAEVVMTSSSCLTGTDRVAEANQKLKFDWVINVQGDEPIIDPMDITKIIEASKKHPNSVVNAYTQIKSKDEYFSSTIPKVVKSLTNDLLYMSRAPIPAGKTSNFDFAYKQICIYAFPKEQLQLFYSCKSKSPFEKAEDIEILRFLEMGVPVKLVAVSGKSIAVDTAEDAEKVRALL